MSKLLGSLTMIAALAVAGLASACGIHESASASQPVTTAAATATPPAATTTTTKPGQAGTGG